MRKKVTQAFRQHDLRVTMHTNSIQTDFLDNTFNLSSNKYWPFKNPKDQPLYLNVQSNQPSMVIKQIPAMSEKRISMNSCTNLAYSCTPNVGNIMATLNKKLIYQHDRSSNTQPCNCRNTDSCPLSGNCREKNIIYQATVRSSYSTMNYFSLCETDYKTRYYNHTYSFRNRSKRKATELSKFVWECKDAESAPSIHWKSVCRAPSYKQGNDHCNLCLAEKFAILTADPKTTLNKRTELINKCRHRNKLKLKNLKS